MKLKEKEFNIAEGYRPKVLLLGNGICRAYGGSEWNGLLDEIKDKEHYRLPAKYYNMPMPLKAALLTNNKLESKMKSLIREKRKDEKNEGNIHWEDFVYCSEEQRIYLNDLLTLDFDYILTTNYSYELEASILNKTNLTPTDIRKLMRTNEVDNAQTKYLINTFNYIYDKYREYNIWHIHGEARKPGSMIIGHNYYGRLLTRIIERLNNGEKIALYKKHIKEKKPIRIGSWVDAFILGDVYVLGLGLSFSETDLWWLLDQKHNFKDARGSTYFFKKKDNESVQRYCTLDNELKCEKIERYVLAEECESLLMKVYGIEIMEFESDDYKSFYSDVKEYLINEMI